MGAGQELPLSPETLAECGALTLKSVRDKGGRP